MLKIGTQQARLFSLVSVFPETDESVNENFASRGDLHDTASSEGFCLAGRLQFREAPDVFPSMASPPSVNVARLTYLLVCEAAGVAIALSTKGTMFEVPMSTGILGGLGVAALPN